jgi:hypothetical protein
MRKLIKKLGYGVAIHFNEYSKKFEVYKIGSYLPGNGISPDSIFVANKSLKKAIKEYQKKFLIH